MVSAIVSFNSIQCICHSIQGIYNSESCQYSGYLPQIVLAIFMVSVIVNLESTCIQCICHSIQCIYNRESWKYSAYLQQWVLVLAVFNVTAIVSLGNIYRMLWVSLQWVLDWRRIQYLFSMFSESWIGEGFSIHYLSLGLGRIQCLFSESWVGEGFSIHYLILGLGENSVSLQWVFVQGCRRICPFPQVLDWGRIQCPINS